MRCFRITITAPPAFDLHEADMTRRLRVLRLAIVCLLVPSLGYAQRQWTEVKSPHFTVATDTNEKTARNIAYQFEQVREVVKRLCPWAPDEIPRPFLVLVPRDENGMKALLPQYADRWNGAHYATVAQGGADREYVVMRGDIFAENTQTTNPYQQAFWPYASVAIHAGLSRELPQWFSRGLADLLSNSIVTDSGIQVGMPFPSKIELLRSAQRPRLQELLTIDRSSSWMGIDRLSVFDAEAWAFVHMLLFGENGVYRPRIDQFITSLMRGTPIGAATEISFKDVDKLEYAFVNYIARPSFSYGTLKVDVNVKRDAFTTRQWSPAETAATIAQLHAASERPVEARARLADARKTNPNLPLIYEAEAELLSDEKKTEESRLAYAKAVELGSTNYYAHYMFANLSRPNADPEMLVKIEKSLDTSTKLNPNFVWSHLLLGEVRLQAGRNEEAVAPLERAVTLERDSVRNRVSLARAYLAVNKREAAQKAAQEALSIASTDAERRSAQQIVDMIQRGVPPPRRP